MPGPGNGVAAGPWPPRAKAAGATADLHPWAKAAGERGDGTWAWTAWAAAAGRLIVTWVNLCPRTTTPFTVPGQRKPAGDGPLEQ